MGSGGWGIGDSLHGKVLPKPLLLAKDTSPFDYDYKVDVGKGTYNYFLSLQSSDLSRQRIMKSMQLSLKSIFGYDIAIKRKNVEVWKLKYAENRNSIRTMSGPSQHLPNLATGFSVQNCSMSDFLGRLTYFISDSNPPFIDCSGIDYNIDIRIDADLTDISDIKRALSRYGFTLVRSKVKMKRLVISDP